jgi:glucosamine-6-phosphate deaminase
MKVIISKDKNELGVRAGVHGGQLISEAIHKKGAANIILATGASQFEMLKNLVKAPVDWDKVTAFHLDEYIAMPESHPASFRRYLRERVLDFVPIKTFYPINAEIDPESEVKRVGEIIRKHPIDVAFVGIGENGHMAFNDPPADFETEVPYLIVNLDEACRRQQMGEGWFKKFEDVPTRAVSMSIKQVMKSDWIICSVPDQRKANAARLCLEGPVTPMAPSSCLQKHERAFIYLDKDSASLLTKFK